MFPGLMSRWVNPLECAKDSARTHLNTISAIAADQNRILVTHDLKTMPRHFGEFLMTGRTCPGVFLVSQYEAIGVIVTELVLIWAASDGEEWENRIVKLPRL